MRFPTWAALLGFVAVAALTAAPVRAEEWCGFHDKAGSRVRCGYSSLTECEQKLAGKNPVCIPSPEFAMRQHGQRQRLALATF